MLFEFIPSTFTRPVDIDLVPGGDRRVHDLGHDQGQQELADDLQNDQDGREERLPLVALEMGQKQLKQEDDRPFVGLGCVRRRPGAPVVEI